MKITLTELIENHSNLITDSSRNSIIKNNMKMQSKVKASIIKQLETQFESVEYVAGTRWIEASFILTGYKNEALDYNAYKNNGAESIDWLEETNMIRDKISKLSSTVISADGEEVYYKVTKRRLVSDAFGMASIQKATKHTYFSEYENFASIEIADSANNTFNKNLSDFVRLEADVDYLLDFRMRQLLNCFQNAIKDANYDIYYNAKVDKDFIEITQETFEEYKEFHKQLMTQHKDVKKKKKLVELITTAVQEKFGFEFAFENYHFFENEHLSNDNYDKKDCVTRLVKRLTDSAKRKEDKFVAETCANIHDTVFMRLKKNGEYAEFLGICFKNIVGLNGELIKCKREISFDARNKNDYKQLLDKLNGVEMYVYDNRYSA